jgi:hypothetical protein
VDVVPVRQEFGIFGGPAGSDLGVELIRANVIEAEVDAQLERGPEV